MGILVHHADEPVHKVCDVTKAAGLQSVAIDSKWVATDRLPYKIGHNASIVEHHTRAVSVKNADDTDLHAVLAIVVKRQGFGNTLALVVARPDADGVDIAPILLNLRVDLWVSVHLRSRGEQKPSACALCEAEHVDSTKNVSLDSFDGVVLVMDRGGGTSKVIDLVNLCGKGLGNVMTEKLEARMVAPACKIFLLAREERVDDDDVVAGLHETVDQMRADEARTACN